MKITIKEILRDSFLSTLVLSFLFLISFVCFEPNLAQAADDELQVTLDVTAGITIDSPSNITMSRNLGVVDNTAVASSVWTIRTNNNAGYNLTVKAGTAPAMKNASSSIADFSTTTTPAAWSTIPTGTAQFGFSAYGTDVNTGTWGAGSSCQSAAHTPATDLNYLGFKTSTSTVVATRSATTTTSGVATTVCYAVEQKGVYIPSGTYTATITATAVTL